jgi:NitT/TauT family transport system ATP-binding protein
MSLSVRVDHIGVDIGGHAILDGVSFSVAAGKFACVIGASGSGKSTLLSALSGLLPPGRGAIFIDGQPVRGVNPRVQYIFQSGAVFPWLTVAENVGFGLRARGVPVEVRPGEVHGYLKLVGLDRVAHSRMHELSGGMAQRVALARALVLQPQVLLMDEPFSALDAISRSALHVELLRLWRETGVTIVFVTHNLREALLLADDVHLLGSTPGRLEASWSVSIPRAERDHHPQLRPLEAELSDRLHLAHPDYEPEGDGVAAPIAVR